MEMDEAGRYTIRELLFCGNQDPDHPALESPGLQPLTYHGLREQVIRVIKTLNAAGFHRNDRIGIVMPQSPEAVVAMVAVMAGFTAVPLNPQLRKGEIEGIIQRAHLKALILPHGVATPAAAAAKVRGVSIFSLVSRPGTAGAFELVPEPEVAGTIQGGFALSSDIAFVLMTSGTTLAPKIVPVTQKQAILSKLQSCPTMNLTAADRSLLIWPYYSSAGISVILHIWLAGGTLICVNDFIPSDFVTLLYRFRPTNYVASSVYHAGILKEIRKVPEGDLKNNPLRFIEAGGDSIPEDVIHELERLLGVPVYISYGSSEAGCISRNNVRKPGSVGIPVIDHLRIADEKGRALGPGIQGEILIRGETVFSGYEDAPEVNRAVFLDGWFRTGDIGYLDNEGFLYLTGRKTEIINKGGQKISPAEVEAVLSTHPQISDVMVFAVRDPVLGEDIAAMVVRTDDRLSEMAIRAYLLDLIARFKIPGRIYFVDRIPKTATGKCLRHLGTERYSPPVQG